MVNRSLFYRSPRPWSSRLKFFGILDRCFAAQYQCAVLVGAVRVKCYDALVLADGNDLDGNGDGITDVNWREKFQGLPQIDGAWPRHIIAKNRRDQ